MKLTGRLKKQVEKACSMDEARDIIEKAGMKLTDDEMEMVAGGVELSNEGDDNTSITGAFSGSGFPQLAQFNAKLE